LFIVIAPHPQGIVRRTEVFASRSRDLRARPAVDHVRGHFFLPAASIVSIVRITVLSGLAAHCATTASALFCLLLPGAFAPPPTPLAG
jgi:hypothetical protein